MEPDFSDLIGKPYLHHGRGPDGYDCYGLVIEAESRYGVDLPDYEYLRATALPEKSGEEIGRGRAKKIPSPVPGAMLLFGNARGLNTHIGVYVGDGMFIHCTMREGVRVERLGPRMGTLSGVYVWQG